MAYFSVIEHMTSFVEALLIIVVFIVYSSCKYVLIEN